MSENKKTEKGFYSALNGWRRAMPIILAALGLFVGVCFLTDSTGALGNGVSTVLLGLFSKGSYAIPFLLILHAIFYASDVAKKRTVSRIIFSVVTVLFISALEYTVIFWSAEMPFTPVEFFTSRSGGGFLGSVLAYALVKVLGKIGLIILAAAVLAVYVTFFFAGENNAFGRVCLMILGHIASFLALIEKGIKKCFGAAKTAKRNKRIKENEKKNAEFANDQFFSVNDGLSELRIKQLGIAEVKEGGEEAPVLQSSVFHKSAAPDAPKDENGADAAESLEPAKKLRTPVKEATAFHANAHRAVPVSAGRKDDAAASPFAASMVSDAPKTSAIKNERSGMGLDESADAVFTESFDPYNFMAAEKIAAKRSSRAAIIEEIPDIEAVDELTEEYYAKKKAMEAHERRLAEFEEAKRRARAEVAEEVKAAPEIPVSAVAAAPVAAAPDPAEADAADTTPAVSGKTVAFNLANEPRRAEGAPVESVTFRRTFDKSEQYAEMERSESERAAAQIAEAVAAGTPFYTRSYNETYTRMSVTGSLDEVAASAAAQLAAQNGAAEAAKAEPAYAPAAPAAEAAYSQVKAEPYAPAAPMAEAAYSQVKAEPAYAPAAPVAEAAYSQVKAEPAYAPAAPMAEAAYSQVKSEPAYAPAAPMAEAAYSQVKAEPAYAPAVAPEIKPEPAPVAPEPVVSVYSSNGAEEAKAEPIIKAFESPYAAAVSPAPVAADKPEVLKVEREAVAPAPVAPRIDPTAQRDSKYTVISGEMQISDGEEAEDSEDEEDSADGIIWSDASADSVSADTLHAPVNAAVESADATVFDFGEDDEEDGEDEDDAVANALELEDGEDDEPYAPIPPEQQNPDILKKRQMFSIFSNDGAENGGTGVTASIAAARSAAEITVDLEDDANADESDAAPVIAAPSASAVPPLTAVPDEIKLPEVSDDIRDEDAEDAPPFDGARIKEAPKAASAAVPAAITDLVPKEALKEEKKAAAKPDYTNYVFPDLNILGLDENVFDESISIETQENADRLVETLASFNVTASIKGVDRGPRITRYEVVPSKGTKVSSVMKLQDDIALSLAAEGIRMEAPIPGKSAIGVEIPNKTSVTVRLRELLETEEFKSSRSKTAVCIGKDVAGHPVINDIAKMPHLLIAGATGMGKSVCINSLMVSMLYKAKPDEVKFIMIDPKQVEFTMYNGIPHLLVPVVSEPKQSAGVLMWAVDEMERRYGLLNGLNVRNIDGYNEKVGKDPTLGETLPRIIIVIDEFADLMLQVKDPVENLVMRIAQKARAAGIHLIIGTQRPTTNVITGTIKANIPSRISCKVAGNVDSRTVLDAAGAEKLLNRGDMLFVFSGAIKPVRVQGAFLTDNEVEEVMNFLKTSTDGAHYDENVMEEINRAAQKCSKKSGGEDSDGDDAGGSGGEGIYSDRQFLDAVELAVNTGKISTSLIQRRISVGYGKAAKFIDWMEEIGVVGEANGQKPREVLINADEWQEKLSRVTRDY